MRIRSLFGITILAAAAMLSGSAFASPQSAGDACEPARRVFNAPPDAFDFFIGEWSVLVEEEEVAHVSVAHVFDEKVLSLTFRALGAPWEGRSYIGLDEVGRWSAIWVDSSPAPSFLFYHGGIEGGVPVLYATEQHHQPEYYPSGEGAFVCGRQRFAMLTDDAFTFTWELSADQGESWSVLDTNTFRRR
ncbi:MAG: hypothetical protein GKS06_20075 [Acidobacteria bacterium]|nr:hypothetical protein [Acidobacteriota bacterium]